MKTLLTYLVSIMFVTLLGGLLWSCDKWDLPTKKTKRECVKPSGTLTAGIQERKVDFSIVNATGTIDKVTWDFGGGGTNSTTVTTGLTASYTYPTSNTYTARATLSNTCGDVTIVSITVSAADATIPTVSLQNATGISTNSATSGMTVTSTGNATITRYGICYSSTNQTPTISDSTKSTSASIGTNTPASFTLTNLQPNTTYYVRSFAINKAGTGYSSPVQTFKTGSLPMVIIAGTPSVGINVSTVNFVVTNSGSPAAIEYGICYSTNSVPDVNNSTVKPVTSPQANSNTPVELTNLTPNAKYYYRAYAKLSTGEIIYSSAVGAFTTQIDTLAQDLIASVSFNDQSLLDISGNNNHVKLVGTSFTTDHSGRANSAVSLSGTGDYFYIPESSSLNPNALTVSLWIKPAAKPTSSKDRMQIYNKSRFSDGANEMYSSLIKLKDDVGPELTIMTDIKQGGSCVAGKGWQSLPFTAPIILNTWYHLVFTYSGRSARMYFNNTLVFTSDSLPYDKIDTCPGGDLKFGAQNQDLPWYFKGSIDDIRIYKRALTAGEVEILSKQ